MKNVKTAQIESRKKMVGDTLACRISLFSRNRFLLCEIVPAKFSFDHYPPSLPALFVRSRFHWSAVRAWCYHRRFELLTALSIAFSFFREQLRRFDCLLRGLRFLARTFLYISHDRSLLEFRN